VVKHREGWLSEDHNVQKFSWESFVTLEDKNRFCKHDCEGSYCAIHYLAQRDGPLCVVDDIGVLLLKDFDVDHIDKNRRNNKRWNLRLKHHTCNSSTQNRTEPTPPASRVSVSEKAARACVGGLLESGVARSWNSCEGADSLAMNALFDSYCMSEGDGPFYVTQGSQRVRTLVELEHLANLASAYIKDARDESGKLIVGHCSPTTLKRYIGVRSVSVSGNPAMFKLSRDSLSKVTLVELNEQWINLQHRAKEKIV
jgi:hypothetical protein